MACTTKSLRVGNILVLNPTTKARTFYRVVNITPPGFLWLIPVYPVNRMGTGVSVLTPPMVLRRFTEVAVRGNPDAAAFRKHMRDAHAAAKKFAARGRPVSLEQPVVTKAKKAKKK